MLEGVLVRGDLRADGMQPFITVGVIEVPVRVDEMFDRIGTETFQRLSNSRTRRGNPGVHQEFAVLSGEHGYVATGTFKHTDIPAQLGYDNFSRCRLVANNC